MPSVITPCGGGGGGGIQFNTDPQDGDWLYVRTTGFDPGNGRGIYLKADGGGIRLLNTGASTTDIDNTGAGAISITTATTDINIFAGNGVAMSADGATGIQLSADGSGDVAIAQTDTGDVDVSTAAGNIFVNAIGGDLTFAVTGGFLAVFGLPTSDPGGSNRLWNDGGTVKIT
jgi:hypothetical protein